MNANTNQGNSAMRGWSRAGSVQSGMAGRESAGFR